MHRRFLGTVAGMLCLGLFWSSEPTRAATYPDRPITMVVPHGAGGSNDTVARFFAKEMAVKLGQSVVVENRSGAGGNIGTAGVARADPDGYTLLMTVNSTQAINPSLYKNVGFDPVKDFAPIGGAGTVPNVLLVNKDVKANTLDELIAEARAKPGLIRYGSAGNGTLPHLMAAMLANKAGINLQHVPYKGISKALGDLLSGQIQMVFATIPAALPHIQSGTLRALAVTSPTRVDVLPDVPAIAEKFPGYEGVLWIALYAPAATPVDVRNKLTEALVAARNTPALRTQLEKMGVTPLDEGPEQMAKRLAAEITRWKSVIKQNNVEIN